MEHPKVFISYSHDSDEHKGWVRKLAKDLIEKGINIVLDQWDTSFGSDLAAFMDSGVGLAKRVLVICTENYVLKADDRKGGVGYEHILVTGELINDLGTNKFIPVMRNNPKHSLPRCLKTRSFVDFNNDDEYGAKLGDLIADLLERPKHPKPELGKVPVGGQDSNHSKDLTVWFESHRQNSTDEFVKMGIGMQWEVNAHIPNGLINVSQSNLLDFALKSRIRTFGWPIGVCVENTLGRPKPTQEGIVTSIKREEKNSFDYWVWSRGGKFYLHKSIFEDQVDPTAIFFNTRIIRTTELLMYLERMYTEMGVSPETIITIENCYFGFQGRTIKARPTRILFENLVAHENTCCTKTSVKLADLKTDLVEPVKEILAPFFILFDYCEFQDKIYREIVTQYQEGKIS